MANQQGPEPKSTLSRIAGELRELSQSLKESPPSGLDKVLNAAFINAGRLLLEAVQAGAFLDDVVMRQLVAEHKSRIDDVADWRVRTGHAWLAFFVNVELQWLPARCPDYLPTLTDGGNLMLRAVDTRRRYALALKMLADLIAADAAQGGSAPESLPAARPPGDEPAVVDEIVSGQVNASMPASAKGEGKQAAELSDEEIRNRLSQKDRDVLSRLYEKKALKVEACVSAEAMAACFPARLEYTRDDLKASLGKLRQLGLVKTKAGSQGGYWLTQRGQRIAKAIEADE